MMRNDHKYPLAAFVLLFVVTLLMLAASVRADAGPIEPADQTVKRLAVTYAEPIPSARFYSRHYFELNDGSTYIYPNYRACARWDKVPNRVCKTVFWYAR